MEAGSIGLIKTILCNLHQLWPSGAQRWIFNNLENYPLIIDLHQDWVIFRLTHFKVYLSNNWNFPRGGGQSCKKNNVHCNVTHSLAGAVILS